MKNKTAVISTAICLLPMVLSAILYDKLPEQVAIHFNSAGSPDNYLPKLAVAFGLPLAFALLNLYSHFRVATEPRVERTASFLRVISRWSAPFLSVILVPITLFISMGSKIPINMVSGLVAGLAVIIAGNYLPKCKMNYSIGIKLPWTLSDEENWNHTHRFAGFIWVIGGIGMIANAFIRIPYFILVIILLLAVAPAVYSYLIYQRTSKKAKGKDQ